MSRPSARLRAWRGRLQAVALGLGSLTLVEITLRLTHVQEVERWAPPRLVQVVVDGQLSGEVQVSGYRHFVEEPLPDGTAGLRTASEYRDRSGQGFPAGGSMRDERFAPQPAAGVKRFFLLGGSAALGLNPVGNRVKADWPTEALGNGTSVLPDRLAISGVLEHDLATAGVPAEVINAGMIAQDSGGVRGIADEVLKFAPDALLLYLGNNEGIGLSWGMHDLTVPGFEPVRGLLRNLRLYRVLAAHLLEPAESAPSTTVTGMGPEGLARITIAQWRSAGRPLLDGDDPTDDVYEAVLARFSANLHQIVQAAAEKGVAVYVIPTPPHLLYPPFAMASDPGLSDDTIREQDGHVQAARAALSKGDATAALDEAEHAVKIDPANAMAWFQEAAALDALSRTDEAVDAYERALMRDVSRKRTEPAFAHIAEEVCAMEGCRTVDAHTLLSTRARTEGTGVYDQVLGDHEHLTPTGCSWVAGLFADLIENGPR